MTMTRTRRVGLVTVVLMTVLGSGCSGRADDSAAQEVNDAGDGASDEAAVEAAAPGDADGAGGDAAGGAGASPAALELTAPARDVVRTGSMRVTVDEVDDAVPEVRSAAGTAQGFVADEQVRSDDDAADLTLRVPAERFDQVRAAVGELGDVTAEDVQAQDVTAEVVDLESRIASQRASVDRVRALLAESGDVVQLATVEGELARRETELETLVGQQRVLADQVALGTLAVHLREPSSADDPGDEEPVGFLDGLGAGWDALVAGGRAAAAAGGFLLPFAVPAAAVLVATRWWRRRPRPSAPAEAGP